LQQDELKVFISNRESVCGECHENLGSQAWIFLNREKGALCLSCADLDHLEFLPSGNMALTLRAKKYSSLCAVVLRWSGSRKHYERQGLLVQREALEKAEAECLKDEDTR
jgi:predicted CXXCH cytochrome family protein